MQPNIQPQYPWVFNTFVDSDWAGDTDTRRSVSGWCIFINGCLISWGSRGQQTVALSSTEAEYIGITEICKEILFINNILKFLSFNVSFPIIIQVDNIGAIFMSDRGEGRRTRHIDIKYHFIREYIEDGLVKIIFVKSAENKADIFTKNTSDSIHQNLTSDYMMPIE